MSEDDPRIARFDDLIEQATLIDQDNLGAALKRQWRLSASSFFEQKIPESQTRNDVVSLLRSETPFKMSHLLVRLEGLRESCAAGDMGPASGERRTDPTLARFDELIQQGEAVDAGTDYVTKPDGLTRGTREVAMPRVDAAAFIAWRTAVVDFLAETLPSDSTHADLPGQVKRYMPAEQNKVALLASLRSFRDLRAKGHLRVAARPVDAGPLDQVRALCERFHAVAVELRARPRKRQPLVMEDEYDVQYLLGGLLQLHFSNITPEDPMPRKAGASSRVDFLLGDHGIVVETKMTRLGLADSKIGAELTVDAKRYKQAGRKALFCFVYDPGHIIRNPVEIEQSLREDDPEFQVEVMIRPKR